MPIQRRRVTISTTDPQNKGGVWGVTEALLQGLSLLECADIQLIYPTSRKALKTTTTELVSGYKAQAFPFRQFLGNTFASHLLSNFRSRIAGSFDDINIAVGGGNQCAIPFLLAKAKYSLWVSNTVDDEHQEIYSGRKRKYDIKMFFAYRIMRPFTKFMEKKIFLNADNIFVESRYSLNLIQRSYGISPQKLVYLPYPMKPQNSVYLKDQ